MRKAKSKTVKTNGRPYNSPNISAGMKKWWKERKKREAASRFSATEEISSGPVGYGKTKKQAARNLRSSIHAQQLETMAVGLGELLSIVKAWQKTP